jgi:hypothetical protein
MTTLSTTMGIDFPYEIDQEQIADLDSRLHTYPGASGSSPWMCLRTRSVEFVCQG